MHDFLKFVFVNWPSLVLGAGGIWIASLVIHQSETPTNKLLVKVVGRLGLSVLITLIFCGPPGMLLGLIGGGAAPFLVGILVAPILVYWALYPLFGPALERYLSADARVPTRSSKEIPGDPET